MTVSTTQVRNVYTDPTAPTYPFTFRALSAADLVVTSIDAAGVETVLTRDTQWRATVLNNTGGTVQLLVSPPGAGGRIVIERSTPLLQPTDYANQGTFYPETHERSFDRLTLQLQEASDAAQRALTENPDGFPWYDAQGNRIINLADAVGPTDAVNLQTLNAAIAGAGSVVEPLTWTFTGDGSERTFAITGAPTDSEGSYQVVIDGLSQSIADYEVNQIADQLVFVTAPPNGSSIFVRAFGFASPMTAMDWDAEGNRIENVGAPIDPTDAATRAYVDAQTATRAALGHTHDAGDVVSGQFAAPRLGGGTPTAVTVLYGDGQWRVPDATAGLPFVARGDLIAFDGTTAQRLGVGTNGQGLIADSSAPLGVTWGSVTVSDEQVQDVVGAMVPTTATITATYDDPAGTLSLAVAAGSIGASQLADGGVTSGKIAAGAVVTAALADGSITTVKIADAQVTVAKISATGTPSSISYLRGDGTWADSPFAATVHTHAAADVTSGIFNPARLGAGYGAIPPGDEQYFMLNAAGTWTRLEALYDGAVVPVGAGPSGGGSIDAETVRDIIGAALTDTATVDFTYNDGADQISAVVVPGSIGLTQVNTASLDTRYALVGSGGSGSLPPGGLQRQFLRGDGNWSNALLGVLNQQGIALHAAFSTEFGGSVIGDVRIIGSQPFVSGFGVELRSTVGDSSQGAFSQITASGGSGAVATITAKTESGGQEYLMRSFDRFFFQISAAGTDSEILGSGSIAASYSIGSNDVSKPVAATLNVHGVIQRGSIPSSSAVTIDASRITSGIAAPARLGGGSPSSSTWLRGDGSWAALPSASGITVTDTPTIDLTFTAGANLSAGIVANSVGPSQLASSLELNANLVVGSASAGISGDKIRQGASTSVAIDGVTSGGPSGTLTGGALLDGSVITRKLGIGSVTATRIADGSVVGSKIANGAVSPAKLSAGGTTPTVDTVYHGDGTWRVPAGGSGGGFISGVANTSSVALTVSGGVLTAQVPVGGINPSRLTASAGTPGPTTFYRGDGQWAVPAGAGGGVGLGDSNIWTNRNEWSQTVGSRQNRAWFAAASNTEAAFRMECVTQPIGDRAGIMHLGNQRTGGGSGNSVLNVLDVQADMNVNGNFDIAMSDVAYARRFNAGAGFLGANWVVAQSPNRDFGTDAGFGYANAPDPQGIGHSWTSGAVCAVEVNSGNTWGDFGLIENRRVAARWLAMMQIVPDSVGRPDGGRNYKYHVSYGVVFARSGPADAADPFKPWQPVLNDGDPGHQAQMHIPIYLEENCTAPGGYQIKAWGGSTDTLAPYCIIRAVGRFQTGLDLAQATYIESNSPAIKMATNQRVRWGTDAEIWYDGTNLKARVGGTTVNIV
jgi:hypothetical protein